MKNRDFRLHRRKILASTAKWRRALALIAEAEARTIEREMRDLKTFRNDISTDSTSHSRGLVGLAVMYSALVAFDHPMPIRFANGIKPDNLKTENGISWSPQILAFSGVISAGVLIVDR